VKRLLVILGLIVIFAGILVYRVWFGPTAVVIVPDETITFDGSVRHYRLVIPNRLPQGQVPIVFAFHGIGDSSPEEMAALIVVSGLGHRSSTGHNRAMWDFLSKQTRDRQRQATPDRPAAPVSTTALPLAPAAKP